MTKTSDPIVFFGSGPVAAKALALLLHDFVVDTVVTKPPAGLNHHEAPVLLLAKNHGLKVYTPENKQALTELFHRESILNKLGVVIDYGIIIDQEAIEHFPLGIVNSHFSLLPQWRGADPITFSILSGQPETGVSLMLINSKMDEGPLLAQVPYVIPADFTTPQLTQELIRLSHDLLCHTIPPYLSGDLKPYPQYTSNPPTYSRKLTKADGKIDWQKSAVQLEREVRAFVEWPKSYTQLGKVDLIITKAHVENLVGTPGKFIVEDKRFVVFCGEQALVIDTLKPGGKPDMSVEGFLAGYRKQLS